MDNDNTNDADETEEFVLDKIFKHRTNKSKKHRYEKIVYLLNHIRWYGYEPAGDTFEPIQHISRSKVISYHKGKRLSIPLNLYESHRRINSATEGVYNRLPIGQEWS